MDEVESVPRGLYERQMFLVLGEDGGLYHADLYRVVEPAGLFAPACSYVKLMVEGAEEHLDPECVETLRRLLRSLR